MSGKKQAELRAQEIEQAQVVVENFIDEYVSRVKQAVDEVYAQTESPRDRAYLSALMHGVAMTTFTIPSGANPLVNSIDAVVATTLRARVAQRAIPRELGPEGAPILEAFLWGEQTAWRKIDNRVDPEQIEELRAVIDAWCEANPHTEYVGLIRLDDFAEFRARTFAGASSRSTSIFSILMIDPFAGLDPTAREIRESRLFAERLFYHVQRMPTLISLQIQAQYDLLMASPGVQQLLSVSDSLRDSALRMTTLTESLPDRITQEREAALDQASALVERERQAAVAQLGEELQLRSEALIDSIMSEEPEVREALDNLRATIESATALSNSIEQTLQTAQELTARPSEAAGGPREPLDLEQVQATIESAHVAVAELNELASSLDAILDPASGAQRSESIQAVLAEAEGSGARMIDRAFNRLFIAVIVLIVGALIVVIAARTWPARRSSSTA